MKIKIEIINGNSNGKCLKELVETAIKRKGYSSFSDFAKLVAERTKSSPHAEMECVSRIVRGQSRRLDPERAKAYSEILEIPEKAILEFSAAGNYHKKGKSIIVDGDDITSAVKRLAQRDLVTTEDLIKEFLFMQHQ